MATQKPKASVAGSKPCSAREPPSPLPRTTTHSRTPLGRATAT
jgi:hypothetical protein